MGSEFIRLIIKDRDRKTIIRKDKNIIPKALKLDFKFKTCFVDIIKEAKIQNWVKKTINKTISGVTAKNLIKPGACAYPTAIKTFLKGILLSFSGKILTPIT